jgi:hypothetical protein
MPKMTLQKIFIALINARYLFMQSYARWADSNP